MANGQLAMKVLDRSDPKFLPHRLRCLAVVLALHANERGCEIYPAMGRLMHLTDLEASAIQKQLRQLVNIGLVIPAIPIKRGRRRKGEYQEWQMQLPIELQRPSWREQYLDSLNRTRGRTGKCGPSSAMPAQIGPASDLNRTSVSFKADDGPQKPLASFNDLLDVPLREKRESEKPAEMPNSSTPPARCEIPNRQANFARLADLGRTLRRDDDATQTTKRG